MDSLDLFLLQSVARPYHVPGVRARIVYKDIEINKRNVKKIRDCIAHGRVTDGSAEIVVYNYRIAKNLGAGRDDALVRAVKDAARQRDAVIRHEDRHVQNNHVFQQVWSLDNPYDRAMIFLMDEVAAYAAEKITSDAPTRDEIYDGLRYGMDKMCQVCREHYAPKHIPYIIECVRPGNIHAMMHQDPVIYSGQCRRMVDSFLTYGGVRALDDEHTLPADITDKWRELVCIYEDETRQSLKQMVARRRAVRGK